MNHRWNFVNSQKAILRDKIAEEYHRTPDESKIELAKELEALRKIYCFRTSILLEKLSNLKDEFT